MIPVKPLLADLLPGSANASSTASRPRRSTAPVPTDDFSATLRRADRPAVESRPYNPVAAPQGMSPAPRPATAPLQSPRSDLRQSARSQPTGSPAAGSGASRYPINGSGATAATAANPVRAGSTGRSDPASAGPDRSETAGDGGAAATDTPARGGRAGRGRAHGHGRAAHAESQGQRSVQRGDKRAARGSTGDGTAGADDSADPARTALRPGELERQAPGAAAAAIGPESGLTRLTAGADGASDAASADPLHGVVADGARDALAAAARRRPGTADEDAAGTPAERAEAGARPPSGERAAGRDAGGRPIAGIEGRRGGPESIGADGARDGTADACHAGERTGRDMTAAGRAAAAGLDGQGDDLAAGGDPLSADADTEAGSSTAAEAHGRGRKVGVDGGGPSSAPAGDPRVAPPPAVDTAAAEGRATGQGAAMPADGRAAASAGMDALLAAAGRALRGVVAGVDDRLPAQFVLERLLPAGAGAEASAATSSPASDAAAAVIDGATSEPPRAAGARPAAAGHELADLLGPARADGMRPGLLAADGSDPAVRRTTGEQQRDESALAALARNGHPLSVPPSSAPVAPAAPVPVATLAAPVGSPDFAQALGQQLSVFVAQQVSTADMVVSPPEMGPIRIELTLRGDSADVAFTAAAPETRQAIEGSAEVLKSMLAEHGIELGRMDLDDGRSQPQGFGARGDGDAPSQRSSSSEPGRQRADGAPVDAPTVQVSPDAVRRRGLVDLLA